MLLLKLHCSGLVSCRHNFDNACSLDVFIWEYSIRNAVLILWNSGVRNVVHCLHFYRSSTNATFLAALFPADIILINACSLDIFIWQYSKQACNAVLILWHSGVWNVVRWLHFYRSSITATCFVLCNSFMSCSFCFLWLK